MDFLQSFLDYTSSYESPTEFFYYAAIAGVSAVLRDNCCMLLGDTKLYPNIYVLIVANPAMRKAKPLNSIIELVKSVNNTKIIEGRTSIQAVIQRLSEIERLKDGKSIQHASGIVYSEELSALFTEDEATIPILTDLYDFKSNYTSSLVTRSSVKLTNVVVSMLGASNEELLKPIFNNRAIYGGLLSRCLIVFGDRVRHRNSLMFEDPKKYDPTELQLCLKKISQLRGYFVMSQEAKVYYDKWYNEICPLLESKANKTGAEGRIHTHVLKMAMLLAAAEYQELKIDVPILEKAIDKCLGLFTNYRRLTLGIGQSKDKELQVIFLKCLWEAGESKNYALSRRELCSKVLWDMSAEDVDRIERTLAEGNHISIKGQKYSLTERSIEFFKSKIELKKK